MIFLDAGVLAAKPVLEFGDFWAAKVQGGASILPWRAQAQEATKQGVQVIDTAGEKGRWMQALVHLQKSHVATTTDLACAWQCLEMGGRLLVHGTNDLGVTTVIKRLERILGQRGQILANRARARVVAFLRDGGPGPEPPELPDVPLYPESVLETIGGQCLLSAAVGGFSAGKLDKTTTLLLEGMVARWLSNLVAPRRIADIGCGIGHAGIAALRHWPSASVVFLDADARALDAVGRNLTRMALLERATRYWWDAQEALPESGFDLALLNPPYHTGTQFDLEISRAMFRALPTQVTSDGIAWMVVNRRLPFREELETTGELRVIVDRGEFLFIEWAPKARP